MSSNLLLARQDQIIESNFLISLKLINKTSKALTRSERFGYKFFSLRILEKIISFLYLCFCNYYSFRNFEDNPVFYKDKIRIDSLNSSQFGVNKTRQLWYAVNDGKVCVSIFTIIIYTGIVITNSERSQTYKSSSHVEHNYHSEKPMPLTKYLHYIEPVSLPKTCFNQYSRQEISFS